MSIALRHPKQPQDHRASTLKIARRWTMPGTETTHPVACDLTLNAYALLLISVKKPSVLPPVSSHSVSRPAIDRNFSSATNVITVWGPRRR